MKEETKYALNTLKMLGIDLISNAQSGNPGITLGAAPIMFALYANILNVFPENPNWLNRDRFILSSGHASALLYSSLYMAGFDITIDDLAKYRRLNSNTPGHPEYQKTPGVEFTSGLSGEGFATAVGTALSERYLNSLLTNQVPKQKVIDYYTYCLCSDGDLMEGVSYEAACFAAKQGLGKLIVLYDSNDMTLDGQKTISTSEDIIKRFDSIGWHVDYVKDGQDVEAITKAVNKAKRITNKPSIIEIKTTIGKGSFNENRNIVHGTPLTKDDIANLRKKLNVPTNLLEVDVTSIEYFRKLIHKRVDKYYNAWNKYYEKFQTTKDQEIEKIIKFLNNQDISLDFKADQFKIQDRYSEEIRESNSKILNIIADRSLFFLGGSADSAIYCKTNIYKSVEMTPKLPLGKNIYFGLREHAMGSILNGMALNGLRVYGSTYLAFADYLKPSIRLSAMMNIPVTYIFTHDSINVSQDGPTHQPIEQLPMLRFTPNLDVYRPADINEVIGCWESILKRKKASCLIISKNPVEVLPTSSGTSTLKGAYIIKKEETDLEAIIISTGTEVTTAIRLAKEISPNIRVVSMPSINIFKEQDQSYQQEILPSNVKKISIEFASTSSWHSISDYQIGIDSFGVSATEEEILNYFKLDYESIKGKIINILNH